MKAHGLLSRVVASPAYLPAACALGLAFKGGVASLSLGANLTSPASLCANLACLLLLTLPLWLVPIRAARPLGVALSALCGLIALADVMYFRYFADLPTAGQLTHAWQLADVGGTMGTVVHPKDALLFLDTAALAVLLWRWPAGASVWGVRARLAGGVALAAVLLLLARGPAMTPQQQSVLAVRFKAHAIAAEVGLAYYHYHDLEKLARLRWGRSTPPENPEAVLARCLESRESILAQTPYQGLARGQNVIVLLLESWSTFTLDYQVGGQPLMPYMAKLRERCLYFPNYYDQTNQASSSDGEFLMSTSLFPAGQGATVFTYDSNTLRGLPRILTENGYSTMYCGYYDSGFWNARTMIPNYGFEKGVFAPFGAPPNPVEQVGWGLADLPLLRRVQELVLQQRSPSYTVVHCSMGHHPFQELPNELKELQLPAELQGTVFGDYLQMCRFRDRNIEAFMAAFEASPLAANTLLVITGDHAAPMTVEELRPALPATEGGAALAHASMLKTPLMFRLPSGKPGVFEQAIGQLDYAPTMAHLLGVEVGATTFLGTNAFLGSTLVANRKWGWVTDGKQMVSLHDGRAVGLPKLELLPPGSGRDLVTAGLAEWSLSDEILDHDMVPWLLSQQPAKTVP